MGVGVLQIKNNRYMAKIKRSIYGGVLMAMSLGTMLSILPAPKVSAATGNILPPFDIGQQWNICQGYNGAATHTGAYYYGLDLTGAACDNSAAGRNARAPLGGTVSYYQASTGSLCINFSGGSIVLTHIDSSLTNGATVTGGQVVGTVAVAGQRNNGNVAHIHLQVWSTANCYGGTMVPFDTAHGARICGAPDLTPGGTGTNGEWSGTVFTGTNCSYDPIAAEPNLIVTRSGSTLYGKNAVNDQWSTLTTGSTADFKVSGNRIAYKDGGGNLVVKDGIGGVWTTIPAPFDDYQISSSLVVLRVGSVLYGKVNATDSTWSTLTTGSTSDFKVAGNRIAYKDGNGNLNVKDGINGAWTQISAPFDEYAFTGSLIVVRVGSTLYGKVNPTDSWTTLTSGFTSGLQVAGDRIAFKNGAGELVAKETLTGAWATLITAYDDYVLTSSMVVVRTNGSLVAKGGLGDLWSVMSTGVGPNYKASGNKMVIIDGSGVLSAKSEVGGTWYQIGGPVDDYRVS